MPERDELTIVRAQIARQVAHWTKAADQLRNLDDLASPGAWNALERYLGVAIRSRLTQSVERLRRQGAALRARLDAAESQIELRSVRQQQLAFRSGYLRTETVLDFYADAVNTRTSPKVAATLRACDSLALRSMSQLLDPLGKSVPAILTYIDKGLGASILKTGLRLWDGRTESPAAVIKIVRHALVKAPTSLIHETGHQVAHITGWNEELAAALERGLADSPGGIAALWSAWASEVAADCFAFVNTGYAAVAGLHDVLAGDDATVFRHVEGDPHPIGYIRILLGVEMCRRHYGEGPWDELAQAWVLQYPLEGAKGEVANLMRLSLPLLPRVVEIALASPMEAFGGRTLAEIVNPERVSPATLDKLEQRLGEALYTSSHWVWTEALRLVAITGLRIATAQERKEEIPKHREDWMLRLGGVLQAA